MKKDLKTRFWSKVSVKSPAECWLWQASRSTKGYGKLWVAGKKQYAHRIAYVLAGGTLEAGQQILHGCNNPACVNPLHLRAGTNYENILDRMATGRQRRGVSTGFAKLTDEKVREIREKYETGQSSMAALGREYGVHPQTVSGIVLGRSWQHVA